MLRVLHARFGTWAQVAKFVHVSERSLKHIRLEEVGVSPSVAFRVARFAKISLDDLLDGRGAPRGTCCYCGRAPDFVDEPTNVESVGGDQRSC